MLREIKTQNKLRKLLGIITQLRSFKNELNVGAGSFIEMSINNISKSQKSFIINNEMILKKLGRIS